MRVIMLEMKVSRNIKHMLIWALLTHTRNFNFQCNNDTSYDNSPKVPSVLWDVVILQKEKNLLSLHKQ